MYAIFGMIVSSFSTLCKENNIEFAAGEYTRVMFESSKNEDKIKIKCFIKKQGGNNVWLLEF